jgi:DsbC/DsbD-like thiol-disulfide interchange protein
MCKGIVIVAVNALLALSAVSVAAQEKPVTWSLKADLPTRPLKSGEEFKVHLTAQIEEGWYLYSMSEQKQSGIGPKPTRISLPSGQPFELADDIDAPIPQSAFDKNWEFETEKYKGAVTFILPVKVSAVATAGTQKLQVLAAYQICSDTICFPLKKETLEAEVNLAAGSLKPRESNEKPKRSRAERRVK